MGKFPFRRPRIISKNFGDMTSSIDGVTKSLQDLVFSYTDQVDRALQKKHVMMAISSLVLLIVLGSFISPKGKADSSIFYPESCLGGWVTPSHAQGELQTTSNGDESQFTTSNSAVLPKNTNAELYCGNFKVHGALDDRTKPKTIIVSLALTKGQDLLLEDTIVGESFASSSQEILDRASSTEVSFTLATTTASSTESNVNETSTSTDEHATSSDTVQVVSGTTTPPVQQEESRSGISEVINAVTESILDLFNTAPAQADTVVIPPEPTPQPPAEPTSFLFKAEKAFFSYFFQTVFADEVATSTVVLEIGTSTEVASTTLATATLSTSTTTSEVASSTDVHATTTEETATTTDGNQFQNNFLEVFYSFDGVTWTSLGELNEISMKYRTFEIPVATSTSWTDMDKLQMKLVSKKNIDETPTVYLDGIKVEVLYEEVLTHVHPDFARDTILKDEIVDGIRVLAIINNETKLEEIWYMYLEEGTSTAALPLGVATSTEATSTEATSTSVRYIALEESGTSSPGTATGTQEASTTDTIKVVNLLKRTWKKYESVGEVKLTQTELIEAIKEQETKEVEKKKEEELVIPNFASDTVKLMKGLFSHLVLVQVERTRTSTATPTTLDELWIYNAENGGQEKISGSTTTPPITIAKDSPIGIKDGFVFWLSSSKDMLFAYNFTTKSIYTKSVPVFNPSIGERAEIHFEETPWKVIVSNEGMSFWKLDVGEVFSDEDSRVVEMLRDKMKLDSVLDRDTLSNLSLPVDVEH